MIDWVAAFPQSYPASWLVLWSLIKIVAVVLPLRAGARAAEPGTVFGEMSALLGGNHKATVRTLRAS